MSRCPEVTGLPHASSSPDIRSSAAANPIYNHPHGPPHPLADARGTPSMNLFGYSGAGLIGASGLLGSDLQGRGSCRACLCRHGRQAALNRAPIELPRLKRSNRSSLAKVQRADGFTAAQVDLRLPKMDMDARHCPSPHLFNQKGSNPHDYTPRLMSRPGIRVLSFSAPAAVHLVLYKKSFCSFFSPARWSSPVSVTPVS
jgi:hypothetical protein